MSGYCKKCGNQQCICEEIKLYNNTTSQNRINSRTSLEWLVYWSLIQEDPVISIGKGKELLGFESMEQMREWFEDYKKQEESK